MTLPHHIWEQLRSITADELCRALERDGWTQDTKRGAELVYLSPSGHRVSIHFHPAKTFGRKLLKALLADIGWSVADLKRLKLVK